MWLTILTGETRCCTHINLPTFLAEAVQYMKREWVHPAEHEGLIHYAQTQEFRTMRHFHRHLGVPELHSAIAALASVSKFVVTAAGRIGKGGLSVQVGDLVVLFSGVAEPRTSCAPSV